MPLFWHQKWMELGHVSQVANFWLSSHNFGEEAAIQKFRYFQNSRESCMGRPCWSQKLATWLTWPSSIHFWSQKSGICYLRGFCGHATSWHNKMSKAASRATSVGSDLFHHMWPRLGGRGGGIQDIRKCMFEKHDTRKFSVVFPCLKERISTTLQ